MKRNQLTKILSTSLSLALVATSAPIPAGAFGPVEAAAPAFVAKLTPPEQFGYVASSFAPNGEKQPRLVLISDLHAHVEVQHNIKGILAHVVDQLRGAGSSMENKTVPIFVEGGWESHLEEPLKSVSNTSVRSFLSEYFLHKAEINASQSYSESVAGTNKVSLIGVESKAEYLLNRAQFLKTYPTRKALLSAILQQEAAIRDITKYLTNRTFAHLQDLRDGYNAGRVRPETFARALVQLARRNGISNGQVRVLQNISTASQADLDVALAQVYSSVQKAVVTKRPLTAFLRQSIKNEDAIRENLARIDGSLDLLKRLVGDQLTPSEVPLAMVRMSELFLVVFACMCALVERWRTPALNDNSVAVILVSVPLLAAALGRCDPGHMSANGLGFLLAALLFASTSARTWRICRNTIVVAMMVLPSFTFFRFSLAGLGAAVARERSAAPVPARIDFAAVYPGVDFSRSDGVLAAPFGYKPNGYGTYLSEGVDYGFYKALENANTPQAVETKIDELARHPERDLLIPVSSESLCAVDEGLQRALMTVLFFSPYLARVQHPRSVHEPLCSYVTGHYRRVRSGRAENFEYELWAPSGGA